MLTCVLLGLGVGGGNGTGNIFVAVLACDFGSGAGNDDSSGTFIGGLLVCVLLGLGAGGGSGTVAGIGYVEIFIADCFCLGTLGGLIQRIFCKIPVFSAEEMSDACAV